MKNLIGFVGVGQCGGNITYLFQSTNYKTFYVNTSKEDLNTLQTDNFYHIAEAQGSNHNRMKALDYVKIHYKNILDAIQSKFVTQKIIYLVFSTGGGTGSGISPLLLDMLATHCEDKVFGAVCILPDLNESISIQVNAYNCMTQLSNIKKLASVFVLDNSKYNKDVVNQNFYNAFESVISLPKHVSTKGNIDVSEIKEMLSVRGISVVATSKNNDYTSIIKSLDQSCFAYQKDKKVVYATLSQKDDIDTKCLFDVIGTPYDVFMNYNDTQYVVCFSGMSFPKDRIATIKNIIDIQKGEITSAIENAKNNSIKNELDWNVSVNVCSTGELNLQEVFKKYQ